MQGVFNSILENWANNNDILHLSVLGKAKAWQHLISSLRSWTSSAFMNPQMLVLSQIFLLLTEYESMYYFFLGVENFVL